MTNHNEKVLSRFFWGFLLFASLSTSAEESGSRLYANGKGWKLEQAVVDDKKRPRVLLIGDSILSGYKNHVIKGLEGKAYVDAWVNPHHQSEHLNNVLLPAVLANGPYDIVHFNIGLHGWQEGRIKGGTFGTLTKGYVQAILKALPKARVLWASSTPVTTKGEPGELKLEPEINPVIVEHNRLAARVMAEMNVPVNDFYTLLSDNLNLARGDRFHWTIPAYKLLGKKVTESVSLELKPILGPEPHKLRVGSSSVNLQADGGMVIAGYIGPRYSDKQEGELRVTAVVCETPGVNKVAIVSCDVLWIPRLIVDAALSEITAKTGISPGNILVNATHTHHAPSTAPAHDFGVSESWCEQVQLGIVQAVVDANKSLEGGACEFFFHLGEEKTIGANSRLLLPDGIVTWINPRRESAGKGKPTGPFDAQLPVLDFRDLQGQSLAIIWNHSTHTIGTLANNVRSPSFYGLAAQELEKETGTVVSFLEGASGSTHNIDAVPVSVCIERLKAVVLDARLKAKRHNVTRLLSIKRSFKFRVRHFNEEDEAAKIKRYCEKYFQAQAKYVGAVFANMRNQLEPQQGEERETLLQVMLIGDVAIVGVPAEYFTVLGVDIKKRSPFKHTFVAELANDWIGYLPDREAHRLGGYQTWMGLHSYAEQGTGERVADDVVAMLKELHD